MNDNTEGTPRPRDEKKRRPDPIPNVPARKGHSDTELTASGSGLGGALEPTVQMDNTESYVAGGTNSQKSEASSDSLLQPALKPAAPKEGQVIANRFVVRRLLGQGGMGRVYAVQDKQIEGRDVALKVLLPKYSKNVQFRKLFFQEVRAAQGFVSEFICQVRDTGETEDGSLFLTMDLIEGESLRTMLDREKVLGARQALEITRQVLLGLQSGHEKGFVHRDIKPPNVMLLNSVPKTDENPYGVAARLLDFGIAGLASEIDERSRAGTVMYMSPEQAGGERLDPRSDLFAVGVLLFEMLSGHRPFEGSTTRALVQSVLETNLTARLSEIPNLSKPVRKLLERALQKERDKRFQSAGEFAAAIERSAAYKLPKEVPSWAYAGLAVLLIAAGGEAFVLKQQSGDVESLKGELQNATAAQLAAVKKAEDQKDVAIRERDGKLATLSDDRDGWKNKFDQTDAARIELQAKLDSTINAAASESEDNTQWDEQIADLKGQLQSERDAKSSLSERLTKLEDSEKIWRERAGKAERDRDAALKRASPQGQLAMTFDRVCELMETNLGQQALKALDNAKQEGVFAKPGVDGADTVVSLVSAAAKVHTYRESVQAGGAPQLRDIVEARRLLDSAEKGAPNFTIEAADWVGFQFDGQQTRDRAERARAITDALKKEVATALAASTQEDSADAAKIDLSRLGSDSKAIFVHADRYGCKEHLSAAAQKLVDQLRAQAATSDQLELDKLRKFTTLPEWSKRLEEGHYTLDASRAADLRSFEFAQRWYADEGPSAKLEWNFAAPAAPTAPTSDWRQVMYLQWQLGQDKANFPIKPGRSLLYKQSGAKKSPAWDKVSYKGPTRFTVEYQAFDDQGFQIGTPDEWGFEFVDGALRVKGAEVPIVDLHARGPGFSVVPFPATAEGLIIPPSLASDSELRKFREYVKSHPLACLAVVETGHERWFSPDFGQVLDQIPGGVRRELVSASSVQ
ncbi:MAG TPA: protein kinase [Planctomycetota bacterium]|nr:protein kinase [Planctomycetota bacterium]